VAEKSHRTESAEVVPRCRQCGREMVLGGEAPLCPRGYFITDTRSSAHVYTGKILWLGSEVYGKKRLLSDELRADTEADMVGGR